MGVWRGKGCLCVCVCGRGSVFWGGGLYCLLLCFLVTHFSYLGSGGKWGGEGKDVGVYCGCRCTGCRWCCKKTLPKAHAQARLSGAQRED